MADDTPPPTPTPTPTPAPASPPKTGVHSDFVAWLMSLTVIMRYFVIAVIFHVGLVALLGSIKIVAIVPKIVASFSGAPLPPPMDDTMPDDPFAAYRDFEYSGPELGGGGGLGGDGAGGVPTAGGEQYAAAIVGEMENEGVNEVIGVFSDSATAMARPSMGPSGLGGAPVSGIGDALAGTGGIKGPGGGIIGGRMGPARATNLKRFGGSQKTEQAVLAALRWLKDNQLPDGSWKGPNPAVTGLAVLAFLGHGENADSKEFGLCVSRGIEYIVKKVPANGAVGNMYHHGIVSITLAEALSLTGSPMLRDPLEKVIKVILDSQNVPKAKKHDKWGWRYTANQDSSDLSVAGWQIMALKSARHAGVDISEEVFQHAAEYVWAQNHESGGFGYSGPGNSWTMTAVGTLCQIFLGNGDDDRLRKALDRMSETKVDWGEAGPGGHTLYGWYYTALAMFQGSITQNKKSYWVDWNKDFQKTLVSNQSEDGHWEYPVKSNETGHGHAYSTAFCTLMLEVYYRYLPIYQVERRSDAEHPAPPSYAPTGAPSPNAG